MGAATAKSAASVIAAIPPAEAAVGRSRRRGVLPDRLPSGEVPRRRAHRAGELADGARVTTSRSFAGGRKQAARMVTFATTFATTATTARMTTTSGTAMT